MTSRPPGGSLNGESPGFVLIRLRGIQQLSKDLHTASL